MPLIIQLKNQKVILILNFDKITWKMIEYLNIFYKNLKELNKNKYDFVFYVAGVDIHFEDRLGKLKISDEGINKRDK